VVFPPASKFRKKMYIVYDVRSQQLLYLNLKCVWKMQEEDPGILLFPDEETDRPVA